MYRARRGALRGGFRGELATNGIFSLLPFEVADFLGALQLELEILFPVGRGAQAALDLLQAAGFEVGPEGSFEALEEGAVEQVFAAALAVDLLLSRRLEAGGGEQEGVACRRDSI